MSIVKILLLFIVFSVFQKQSNAQNICQCDTVWIKSSFDTSKSLITYDWKYSIKYNNKNIALSFGANYPPIVLLRKKHGYYFKKNGAPLFLFNKSKMQWQTDDLSTFGKYKVNLSKQLDNYFIFDFYLISKNKSQIIMQVSVDENLNFQYIIFYNVHYGIDIKCNCAR
jgi:hypothetical protein